MRDRSPPQLPLFHKQITASTQEQRELSELESELERHRSVAAKLPSNVYLGTSSWSFPGWQGLVYPHKRSVAELSHSGPGLLFQRLAQLDPAAARAIGPSNGRRIVRALEVIELTGEPFGSGLPSEDALWRPTTLIGLRAERDVLVERLDGRVAQMWAEGLVEEARGLGALGVTAARAIGYAQARAQLAGELTEHAAIEQAQALTRRYARRQVGWFRRYPAVTWLDWDDPRRVATALNTIAATSSDAATTSA